MFLVKVIFVISAFINLSANAQQCSCGSITDLGVTDRNIQNLVKEAFILYDIKNFINLTLDRNDIKTLNKDCFTAMYNLQYLSLQDNKIEELHEETFKDNRELLQINLINNRLTRIENKMFENLYELHSLWLSSNNIDFIGKYAFEDLKELQSLYLAENRIEVLDPEIFLYTKQLQQLHLQLNKLKTLNKTTFSELKHLETLILNGNHLTAIDKDLFTDLRYLENLILSNNKIKVIDKDTFKHNIYLNILNLEGNQLEELPDELFINAPNLQYLRLAENNLHKIGVFPPTVILIELHQNKFQYLDVEELKKLTNLTAMYLHKNPWNCNCDLKNLIEFFVAKSTGIEERFVPSCYSPEAVLDKEWTKINPTDFTCETTKIAKRDSPLKLISDELKKNCTEDCVAQTSTLLLVKPLN